MFSYITCLIEYLRGVVCFIIYGPKPLNASLLVAKAIWSTLTLFFMPYFQNQLINFTSVVFYHLEVSTPVDRTINQQALPLRMLVA